jgi:hypothetical protein
MIFFNFGAGAKKAKERKDTPYASRHFLRPPSSQNASNPYHLPWP